MIESINQFIKNFNFSLYLVPLHVISVVAWFSGLFYIVRLYVYHVEANDKPKQEKDILQAQFLMMQRRLWYGITWPAAVATIMLGIWIMIDYGYIKAGWMHVKLLFVAGLVLFHFLCGRIRRNLALGKTTFTPFQLRLLNEVPTIFLFAIVFIVYMKEFFSGVYAGIVMTLLIIFLIGGTYMYKHLRERAKKKSEKKSIEEGLDHATSDCEEDTVV